MRLLLSSLIHNNGGKLCSIPSELASYAPAQKQDRDHERNVRDFQAHSSRLKSSSSAPSNVCHSFGRRSPTETMDFFTIFSETIHDCFCTSYLPQNMLFQTFHRRSQAGTCNLPSRVLYSSRGISRNVFPPCRGHVVRLITQPDRNFMASDSCVQNPPIASSMRTFRPSNPLRLVCCCPETRQKPSQRYPAFLG